MGTSVGSSGGMDPEVASLMDDYRRVNSDEDLSYAEQEEALSEIANQIKARQARLLEEEGHTGIGDNA